MESTSPADRRQAWAHSSRRCLILEDAERRGSDPPTRVSLQDDVFTDGCSTGKIETWLQGCGNEANQENLSHLNVELLLKTGNSFEDDLSLGAEAIALDVGSRDEEIEYCPLLLPPPKSRRKDYRGSTPQQKLNLPFHALGQSMASSAFSSIATTASSVSEVLQMCAEDAEETLYQLGFGCEEPQVTARIPARFFSFPSQLRGINFRLFLESQLHRIREEDPNLSLASRFRQVEVLTAMANAFYSLYSHVSRTPLQKLAPPEFSFSSPTVERTIGQRFFASIRTEPRSPVERLKDTVSKMCLYTGSRGSESASPNSSPRKRNSLPDVVSMVLGTVRDDGGREEGTKTWPQELAENLACRAGTEAGPGQSVQVSGGPPAGRASEPEKATNAHRERIQRWSQSGKRDVARTKACLLEEASLETTGAPKSRNDMDINEGSIGSPLLNTTLNKLDPKAQVAIIAYDVLCPHVVESVHQGPYLCGQTDTNAAKGSSIQMLNESSTQRNFEPKDKPSLADAQPQICLPPGEEDGYLVKARSEDSQSDLVYCDPTSKQRTPCQIMVQSAGEEETVSQCSAFTLTVAAATPQKYLPLRGDSFQSDSSGYVEEDMQHSLTTPIKEIS
ncbi:protein ITPRID2 isoform X2 [Brachyhypopomus gauderio]|uniref:protein ITPRID2 isoform X2 n=1 Tax=Brachyhypopomus gauderio TaxID=698409 RepID=UPI004042DC35